jgi:tetratricopeptide (TPR) repeat protein
VRYPLVAFAFAIGISGSHAQAQSVAHHLAAGDSLDAALRPAESLVHFRAALALDSTNGEAAWKAARAQVDVAKQLRAESERRARDSLYAVARELGELAVRLDTTNADAHFILAVALGEFSRTKGGTDRLRFAKEIYDETSRALALAPDHDGARHVMGAWHAEVRRLSGFTRFMAKAIFGAGFLGRASWDSAAAHLERAVALRPEYIHHRLELAQIYVDMKRPDDARRELEAIAALLPVTDVLDPIHKADAAALLERLGRARD